MAHQLLFKQASWLVAMPRLAKKLLMLSADALVAPFLFWAAYALRLNTFFPVIEDPVMLLAAPLVTLPVLYAFGFYRSIVRYVGPEVAWSIIWGVAVSAVILAATAFMFQAFVPRSAFIIYSALMVLYLGGSRFLMRRFLYRVLGNRFNREPVAVFGAGNAGAELVSALLASNSHNPIIVVDDDPGKQGTLLYGVPVVSRAGLEKAVRKEQLSTVLLALPSQKRTARMEIVRWLDTLQLHVQTVPSLADIASGKASLEEVKDVAIEDLLGRDMVPPNQELLLRCIKDKSVLVTGAGGSIGSELCRQILALKPQRLLLLEQSEYALYSIEAELLELKKKLGLDVQISSVLGSVVNRGLVEKMCRQGRVDTVYHAAAYKHVPIVEGNPESGVRNNILGTYEAALGAEAAGVRHFILISTDKAVRPTNIMGATKRFAEMVLQAMADRGSETVFSMVRFGNVLGSSGSVVPLFRKQIQQGGPVTVTHPDVIRYFMTIPEASQLVIQAGAMAKGGEVFVLDMGEPVRILDLATTMVYLMGLTVRDEENPVGDIEIAFSGLRPGEKLYEELLIGESSVRTEHEMIMQAFEEKLEWTELEFALEAFRGILEQGDEKAMGALLLRYVSGYRPGTAGDLEASVLSTRSLGDRRA